MTEENKLTSSNRIIYAGAVRAIADGFYPDIEKFISYLPEAEPEQDNTDTDFTSQDAPGEDS